VKPESLVGDQWVRTVGGRHEIHVSGPVERERLIQIDAMCPPAFLQLLRDADGVLHASPDRERRGESREP
jgi:hypothetical protein